MASPITIDFKVNNQAAIAGIKQVETSLLGVVEVAKTATASLGQSAAIEVKADTTQAVQQVEEVQELVQSLPSTNNAASDNLTVSVNTREAVDNLEAFTVSLNDVPEAAKQLTVEVNRALNAISNRTAVLPNVEASGAINDLSTVEAAADDATEAINESDAEFPDISPSTQKAVKDLTEIRKAASNVSETIVETGKSNPYRDLDAATERTVRQLDRLLEETQAVKQELQSSDFAFSFDASGEAQSLETLNAKIEQIIDATELLTDKSSEIDYGGKWTGKGASDIDALIAKHWELVEASEVSADKQAEAQAKLDAKTEASAEAYRESQLLKTGSLEELENALADYQAKLEESVKAEDKAASLTYQKKIDATTAAIARQTKALERQTASTRVANTAETRRAAELIRGGSASEHIMSDVAAATADAAAKSLAASQGQNSLSRAFGAAGASAKAFGTAVKTSLGPMGAILIALEAGTWLLGKAWEYLSGVFDIGGKKAKEAAKSTEEQAKATKKVADEFNRAADAVKEMASAEAVTNRILDAESRITQEYQNRSALAKEILTTRLNELRVADIESGNAYNLAKGELDIKLVNNEITRDQYELESLQLKNAEAREKRERELAKLRALAEEAQSSSVSATASAESAQARVNEIRRALSISGGNIDVDAFSKQLDKFNAAEEGRLSATSQVDIDRFTREKLEAREELNASREIVRELGFQVSSYKRTLSILRDVETEYNGLNDALSDINKKAKEAADNFSNLSNQIAQTERENRAIAQGETQAVTLARRRQSATAQATARQNRVESQLSSNALAYDQLTISELLEEVAKLKRLYDSALKAGDTQRANFLKSDLGNAQSSLSNASASRANAIASDGILDRKEAAQLPQLTRALAQQPRSDGLATAINALIPLLENTLKEGQRNSELTRTMLSKISGYNQQLKRIQGNLKTIRRTVD